MTVVVVVVVVVFIVDSVVDVVSNHCVHVCCVGIVSGIWVATSRWWHGASWTHTCRPLREKLWSTSKRATSGTPRYCDPHAHAHTHTRTRAHAHTHTHTHTHTPPLK